MLKKQLYVEPQTEVLELNAEAVICQSFNEIAPNGIEEGSLIPSTSFDLL